MEPDLEARNAGGLRLRVLSAMVLAPLPLAAIWAGGAWLALLTGAAGTIMAWEWGRMCQVSAGRSSPASPAVTALVAVVAAAIAIAARGTAQAAIVVALLGAGIVCTLARYRSERAPLWMALGTVWIAVPCIGLLWLARAEGGRLVALWLFAVVWATDIGAYAVGRAIGGPRLAPRVSPRKTWAGLLGGMTCAALVGAAAAAALKLPAMLPLVLLSAGLAIIAQFGDLAESLAKRRFGVKDTSGLIPGHGGLFDRLDGLLAAVAAIALMTFFAGRSVIAWQ